VTVLNAKRLLCAFSRPLKTWSSVGRALPRWHGGHVRLRDEENKTLYHGHRVPAAVINQAFRWYIRFPLSLRDIEELLFERGLIVCYETVRRRCDIAHRVKATRRKTGSTWHLGEVFLTSRGEPYLLWRAADQHGAELDILLEKRRDKAAAKRFFKRMRASCPEAPRKIVTDQLRSYPAAKAEIPELAEVKHVSSEPVPGSTIGPKTAISQPTRERERRACVVFVMPNAPKRSCRALVWSASTHHSVGHRGDE
jgi:putative transposase